jgi:hypothetical protein
LEFVSSCISVEVATLLVSLVLEVELLVLRGDILEAAESSDTLSVYVHVVELWLLNRFELLLLGDLLLEHLHFLLVLLDAHVGAVSKNVSVDDLGGSENLGGLFIAEATSRLL